MDAKQIDEKPIGLPCTAPEDLKYDLSDDLIAKYAVEPRDASRLLVRLPGSSRAAGGLAAHVRQALAAAGARTTEETGDIASCEKAGFADMHFRDLAQLLPPNSHLIFNESRVFAARLRAQMVPVGSPNRQSMHTKAVEVLLLSPHADANDGIAVGDSATELMKPVHDQCWRAMVRASRADCPLGTSLVCIAPSSENRQSPMLLAMKVEQHLSAWEEEGEADGVEAALRLSLRHTHAATASTHGPQPKSTSFTDDVDTSGTPGSPASHTAESKGTSASDPKGSLAQSLSAVLTALGETPLPPYMRRAAEAADTLRYQTVYAAFERTGSVAAPTAGLHFTPDLLSALKSKGVKTSMVALHVGAGTFKPVVASTISEHEMHAERYSISVGQIEEIVASLADGRPVIPVGTTSARTLESLYWAARRLGTSQSAASPPPLSSKSSSSSSSPVAATVVSVGHVQQWEPYSYPPLDAAAFANQASDPNSPMRCFQRLIDMAKANHASELAGSTSLCIAPGYQFKLCDGLLTNFHAPDSTLMMLIAALVGDAPAVRRMYAHAMRGRYRFLSYGDSNFILNPQRAHGSG